MATSESVEALYQKLALKVFWLSTRGRAASCATMMGTTKMYTYVLYVLMFQNYYSREN